MDSDAIGIISFATVVFGAITAVLLWARAKGQVRRKAVVGMTQALGFHSLKDNHPPENFPLKSFPVMRWGEKLPRGEKSSRIFSMAATGTRGGREVLCFDYFLFQSSGKTVNATVAHTFVAVRGGPECFQVIADPTLKLETAEGWTLAYWQKKILPAEELKALIFAIPEKA